MSNDPPLTCESNDDCPAAQSCLQHACVAVELPSVHILAPEDEQAYPYGDGSTAHTEVLSVSASNLVLRSQAESSEAVVGEGYLVVFVDELEVGVLDSGDVEAGVQLPIELPDVPGVHRIRVQARLNDGSDYDHEQGAARHLIWVDDGRKHIALRRPWPNDAFPLEQQLIEAEVVGFGLEIGTPSSGLPHGKVWYDQSFPACLDDPTCAYGYNGLVPNDDDPFGPVLLPEAGAGAVTLTVVAHNPDHTLYTDELGEPVWSSLDIVRSDD